MSKTHIRRDAVSRTKRPNKTSEADRPPSSDAGHAGPPIGDKPSVLSIRSTKGTTALKEEGPIKSAAMEWTYVVRNRQRWRSLKNSAARQDDRARAFLTKGLKISEDTLEQIANEGAVEVVVLFERESVGWEQRILPWEFVLSAATRTRRRAPLTVTRQLVTRHAPQPSPMSSPQVLYVECAPGNLGQRPPSVADNLSWKRL